MRAGSRDPSTSRGVLLALALLGGLVVAAAGYGAGPPASRPPERPPDPQRLVFLLEYIGTDYGLAVRDGTVVNQAEYGEVLRFTKQLMRDCAPHRAVVAGLQSLQQLIERRAPAEEVWTSTRKVLPVLTRALGGAAKPATLPNVATGRRLYANDCAPCHGLSGGGDGPSASGLDPPPTAFRGELLERSSPRQVYSAVSYGLDGTAMPSFSAAYSEQQRWDVAFYVMTLRVDFDPKRPAGAPQFGLEELAASSNAELLARLRQTRPGATPEEVDYLRINFAPRPGTVAPLAGPDAGAPGGLAVALQLQDAFTRVAERVLPHVVGVSGYVRDPEWTPEKLRAQRGDGWIGSHADALRYPGFRLVRSGSGFVVDEEGWVLSCDHLVRDERGEVVQFVDVELPDQTHLAGNVVGAEPTIDLAVVHVADAARMAGEGTGGEAAALEFGDSDHLQVGHWLIALGDPPGPGKTFAVGMVSGSPERQCYQEVLSATRLQSSLVVPAGGLGGPVADILGHVVGMTVHQQGPAEPPLPPAATDTMQPVHILPMNLVLNIYEALKVAQSRRSPWIGVSVLELPSLRRRLGTEAQSKPIPQTGLYIDDVFDPSPASRAGVRPGDFLLGLAGHKVVSVGDFQTWLYVTGIGAQAELELQRDGQPLRMTVPIEERPASATTR